MADEDYKPKLRTQLDVTKLSLDAEEGFVLSRIDGATSLRSLEHLTGLPRERLQQIVGRLEHEGALEGGPARAVPAPVEMTIPDQPPVGDDDWDDDEETSDVRIDPEELLFSDGEREDEEQVGAESDLLDDGPPAEEPEEALAQDEAEADDDDDEPPADEAEEERADGEDAERQEANYRKLYETELKQLERDQRVALAQTATDATLCALCFDPDPAVIRAVLDNLGCGLAHGRLIAAHHRNPVGLDALAKKPQLLRDGQVQRFVLRNLQASDGLLRRVLANKPLLHLYRLVRSRELSERAKRVSRQSFRKTFSQTTAEDRVALVFQTEGRCLTMLIGLSFEGKTAALLCSRTYTSSLLIQNVLRFAATPPLVLQHLAKQQSVRRSPQLKRLVLQHPNCPSQIKRNG